MSHIRLILFSFLLILFSGCASHFEEFNEQAFVFATNDKHIDQEEYETLLKQISLSDERGFQQFKGDDGQLNHQKVLAYLLKYFRAKRLALTAADIWQPEMAASPKMDTFNVNVFLENSASMDGYVKGNTAFESAIYNLLGDFKITGLCDSLNLNYINKSIPYTKKNASSSDIQNFIERLEPATFSERGGDRSVSDLKNILSCVLKTVDEKNASVLISDFVFSPGNNSNAQDFLNNQSIGIKIDFAEKLKTLDLAVVVTQLTSVFDGIYYDKNNKPISLRSERPYYIWIIGTTGQVKSMLDKKMLDNIKGGYQNRLVLQSIKKVNEPNFKILYRPRIGEFDSSSLAQGMIRHAAASNENQTKGIFGFEVAVDFSNSLQDMRYFLDTAVYRLNDKHYQLKVETTSDQNDAALIGFTHVLRLQTTTLREETLKIEVIGNIPAWVYRSTSTDDSDIANNDSEKQKTFGLGFVMEGISDAFYPRSSTNAMNSISITIKR